MGLKTSAPRWGKKRNINTLVFKLSNVDRLHMLPGILSVDHRNDEFIHELVFASIAENRIL
jgi:hypothetical protein